MKNQTPPSRAFASVVILLFLATTAATVIASARDAQAGTQRSTLATEMIHARMAADAGYALVLSAQRAGTPTGSIVVDPSLPVITITETTETSGTVFRISASVGSSIAERTYQP